MSAYVVDEQTIINVVRAYDFLLEHPMFRVHPPTRGSNPKPSEIGNMLYSMNIEAVNQRYGKKMEVAPIRCKVFGLMPVFDILQSYKSIDCLLYQCSEGTTPETDLYKWLEYLKSQIAHYMVCTYVTTEGERYEDKDWG